MNIQSATNERVKLYVIKMLLPIAMPEPKEGEEPKEAPKQNFYFQGIALTSHGKEGGIQAQMQYNSWVENVKDAACFSDEDHARKWLGVIEDQTATIEDYGYFDPLSNAVVNKKGQGIERPLYMLTDDTDFRVKLTPPNGKS